MLIAIISDIHDNLANLDKCLDWCRQNRMEKIIFCGDATTTETLEHLGENFPGEIFMVRGNIELFEPETTTPINVSYRGEIGQDKIGNCQIGFCHEPQKLGKVKALAAMPLDFIFYGHTHKPWLEMSGSTVVANPGNLAGTFHQATFATLDTETRRLELRILAEL